MDGFTGFFRGFSRISTGFCGFFYLDHLGTRLPGAKKNNIRKSLGYLPKNLGFGINTFVLICFLGSLGNIQN